MRGSSAIGPVNALWIGGAMTTIARLAVTSFQRCGHGVRLYAYDDIPNVARCVDLLDACEVLLRSELERFAGNIVQFSDRFRWRLLMERGGYWVDTDLVCLRAFRFSQALVFGSGQTASRARRC